VYVFSGAATNAEIIAPTGGLWGALLFGLLIGTLINMGFTGHNGKSLGDVMSPRKRGLPPTVTR
jgi:hypothetical protein